MKKDKNKRALLIATIMSFVFPFISLAQGTLIFKSSFGGTTGITLRSGKQHHYDIRGNEGLTKSDWFNDLEQNPYIGSGQFYMEQGDESLRSANIVADPVDPTNKVLQMRITDQHILMPSGERKCRIQYELDNKNMPPAGGYMKEYYQKCRLYFSPDFKVLEDVVGDNIGWIIMQEYWNDPQYNAPNRGYRQQARTGIQIVKRNGKLRFGAKGRDPEMEVPATGNNSWESINYNFAIPLGKWMTQEIYVKEGGSAGTSNPGRFYMSITVDNVKTVIVDKIGMTTSEATGYVPDGQSSWTPLKIYTEGKVGQTFFNNQKVMDVYWDDLEIWMNKAPNNCGSVVPLTNYSMPTQTGTFTYEFDVVPGGNYMNGLVGLSNGPATAYANLGCIVQFDIDGTIKARNGAVYAATNVLPYIEANTYHVKMDVNISTRKYDVFVTPEGLPKVQIATNYSFRSEQASVSQLNNLTLGTETCGLTLKNYLSTATFEVDNSFVIFPNPLTQNQEFTIKFNSEVQKATIEIYDINARLIQEFKTENLSNYKVKLNTDLKSGIYIVKVLDGKKVFQQKLIVE